MEQGFLEQEAKRANKKNRKFFLAMLFIFIVPITVIGFAVKDSIDFNDYTTRKIIVFLIILASIMLISVVVGLFFSSRAAANGSKSLLLPFKDNTPEAVAEIIDREVSEGKIQVDEYIYSFAEGKKPHGERIVLIPSYLLLFNGVGRVITIPIDKIYWLCAQVGLKGRSSYIVRLLIFTEQKTFYVDGVDIEHVQNIANKLYQYIPNIFSEHDPFTLSYELEKLFDKNRGEFLKLYENAKHSYQFK